ncbi:MAG: tyrosine--tRNA ligase [Patescibacteria group bacterium]|nr:tyrosine--tRNA ligase [Patescibacteria group bacterium]
MDHSDQILRGASEVFTKAELKAILASEKKLRIYYGVDPSGSQIHLGHAVVLSKLQILQQLGHKIIFLVGDFTGMIGDPTDRNAVRQPLTRRQVLENAKTYKKQVSKFLSFEGKNKAEIRFNSEWNDRLTFKDIIELSGKFTVQQFLERDMFEKRMNEGKPISLHEFLYPLIQGYDAVELDADMQVGGTDQTFNMLQGRYLMKALKNKAQTVITYQLLEGSDGRKMSKSFNNVINIEDEPNEMFGKTMSISDELIKQYFVLATWVPLEKIEEIIRLPNPRDQKLILAEEITKLYHGEKKAVSARQAFINQFSKGELPSKIPTQRISQGTYKLSVLLFEAGLVASKSEARRVIEQRGVRVNGVVAETDADLVKAKEGVLLQVGKRKFIRLI